MDADQAVERQPNETTKAHSAFMDYLLMPEAGRSLRKLHEQYLKRAEQGADPPTTRLPTLEGWSRVYTWQARLGAVQAEERRKRLAAEQEARAKMNQRHIQTAQGFQAKVVQWLKNADSTLDKPGDVLAAWKVSVEVERKAMGIPEVLMHLQAMTDDQILDRYQELMGSLAGGAPVVEDFNPEEFME
jgi:hypothetical protein